MPTKLDERSKRTSTTRVDILRRSLSTPKKTSSGYHSSSETMTRDIVESLLVEELVGRQWVSNDLVTHTFGDTVSLSLGGHILFYFLWKGILTVECAGVPVSQDGYAEACMYSVTATAKLVGTIPPDTEKDDKYIWQWHKSLKTGKEDQTVDFLNVVGHLAYVVAYAVSESFREKLTPKVRFSTMPGPNRPFPLPHGSQDSRPDIFGLDNSAFFKEELPEHNNAAHRVSSLAQTIKKKFPSFLSCASPQPTDRSPSYDAQTTNEWSDLTQQLNDLGKLLRSNRLPALTLPPHLHDLMEAEYLDISYACFPGVKCTGEVKMTSTHILQACVYMRQHRCTQPHMRSVLGLHINSSAITLLRADAIGTERHR
ncbi:hypothetical protein OBBRIDRAFT_569000, partial [Obba rivulosa]